MQVVMMILHLLNGEIAKIPVAIAISQNVYSKAYSGADVITIIQTDKSIKEHAYDKIKKK